MTATGAIPNDGLDDQPAILSAINQALATNGPHAVCFPGGTYDILTKSSGVSFNLGNPGGTGPATDLALIGVGPASVIRMNGNGAAAAWTLFQINNGAQRIAFRDLVLDGASVTNAGTATSLLAIGTGDASTISDIVADGVTFRNSPKNAITMQGSSSSGTVSYVSIRSSRISNNGNSGITIFQGVQQTQITGNVIDGNAGLDIETTFSGTPTAISPIDGLSISSNVITRTSASPVSLYLHGYDTNTNKDLTVDGNVISNGRIHISDFDRFIVENNIVTGGAATTTDSELYIDRHGDGSVIEGNLLIRQSTAAAPALYMLYTSVDAPRRTVVRGNVVVQSSLSNIVQLQSVTNLVFSGNVVEFAPTTSSTNVYYGVVVRSSLVAVDFVQLSNNLVLGNLSPASNSLSTAFFFLPSSTSAINRISVTGNQSLACAAGVVFDSGAAYTTIPFVADNIFDGATVDISGFGLIKAAAIGGNIGGAIQLTGNGSPLSNVAAPPGSIFFRRDGGSGSSLYVKESGTDATGWVAK